MPPGRPGPRKPNVVVRIDETTIEAVDRRASEDGETRSSWLRCAVLYALLHMPKGWRPS